jgi:hypothetical protein
MGLGEIIKIIYHSINKEKKVEESKAISTTEKINQMLIQEKLITKPLSSTEISRLVDIKSREGFYFDELFNNYKMIYYETYNFMTYASVKFSNNLFVRNYEKFAMKKYPKEGPTFFVVYKKP